jgi:hypothetical protein
VIIKKRAAVSLAEVGPLLDGTWDELPRCKSESDRKNLESFLYYQTVTHARPYVLVRAWRESYCTPDPIEDVRMTFDRRICYQPARGATLHSDPERWIPLDGNMQHGRQGTHTLVELKFPGVMPPWMRELVERLEMFRVSYSKYVAAVTHLVDGEYADGLELDAACGRRG